MRSFSMSVILVIPIIWTSCRIDGNKRVSQNELKFSTTDDSELFFKNLRLSYYDSREIPDKKIVIYRSRDRQNAGSHPLLNVAIEWHWLTDSAFLLLEPNPDFGDGEYEIDRIERHCPDLLETKTIQRILSMSKIEQTTLAIYIYNGILDDCTVIVTIDNASVELFSENAQKEVFRQTVSDFLRLVRVYN